MSRRYQSQEYPCSVTVIAEDGDKPSQMIEKAKLWLIELRKVAREIAEKELLELIIEKEAAEAAKFKTGFDKVEKSGKTDVKLTSRNVSDGETPDSKPLPVVAEVISTPTVEETVLMSPNEVTMLVKTGLSMLVTKKGFQKWIPFSLMPEIDKDSYNPGEYIEIITIKDDKAKWFNEIKSWDKLEVRKS